MKKEKQKTWISLLSSNIFAPKDYVYQVSLGLDLCAIFVRFCTSNADDHVYHVSLRSEQKCGLHVHLCPFLRRWRWFPRACSRGNQFCCKISFVHHDLEIMCTKFHWDRSKNARCARIFVHFCTFRADFRALRARKSKIEKAITCRMVQRPYVPSFIQFHAFLGQLQCRFLFDSQRTRLIPLPTTTTYERPSFVVCRSLRSRQN